ncbi:hypothetical protein A9973_18805 [Achromobacter sp. UMC46]|nr:hypothetical protein [Achromobacter sp. UMC46]
MVVLQDRLQLVEYAERAVGKQLAFSGIAFDRPDTAQSVALVRDAAAFCEDVRRPLFRFFNIHDIDPISFRA